MYPIASLLRVLGVVAAAAFAVLLGFEALGVGTDVLGAVLRALAVAAVAAPFLYLWGLEGAARKIAATSADRLGRLQFRALLDAVAEGAVFVDVDGRITHVNRRTEELFGFERTELVNQPIEVLVPERFREAHVKHREGYMAAPKLVPLGIGRELLARRRDGSEFPMELSLSPIGDGEKIGVLAMVTDISERRRISEAARE